MKRITIDLDDDLYEALRAQASREDRTQSAVVRRALLKELGIQGSKDLPEGERS